jgi:hypothetical protein
MPDIGLAELIIVLVELALAALIVAVPFAILRQLRRRGDQLDRIERRLDDLDRRGGSGAR